LTPKEEHREWVKLSSYSMGHYGENTRRHDILMRGGSEVKKGRDKQKRKGPMSKNAWSP